MITIDRHIAAPPERVFALISDFANAPKRIPAILRVEMLTSGPVGIGTRFSETRKMFGKEATETMEVVAFDAPRSYSLRAYNCGCEYNSSFGVEPDGAGSKLTFHFDAKPVTLMAKLMSPLAHLMMGPMLRKCVAQDLEGIQKAAEGGVATGE